MKKDLANLLESTKRIIQHNTEKEILRAEKFNIFSILKLEHYENTTHSTFIGELLNPIGSHLKGNIFLALFLNRIGVDYIDLDSAQVSLEFSIGSRDDILKSGGRMDIYIHDCKNQGVAIENKIYAVDQNCQIERYYNYNPSEQYRVYYLTLLGSNPSSTSSGELKAGIDFFVISYKETILDWLNDCFKESADTPILRETIRQYIILIKKLTNTMERKDEKELLDLIFTYPEESHFIASNFINAQQNLSEEIRQKVILSLRNSLNDNYFVNPGAPSKNVYSQIWITLKDREEHSIQFGVESFSGKGFFNVGLFVGVFNNLNNGDHHPFSQVSEYENSRTNIWWIDQYQIPDFEGYKVNFSDFKFLARLFKDNKFEIAFIEYLTSQVKNYIERKWLQIEEFLKNSISNE